MRHGSWQIAHTRARGGHPLVGLTACVHGLPLENPSWGHPGRGDGSRADRPRGLRGVACRLPLLVSPP